MGRDAMELAVSTDVVMDNVMSHLKVTDLLNCREVSKFWNRAASSVLRRRSAMMKRLYDEQDLLDLEECIKGSSDFPFTGLQFHKLRGFGSVGAMEFFHSYGDIFTRLRLDGLLTSRLQDTAPFIKHLTRLSILEFRPPIHNPWRLDLATVPEDEQMLKLPSVRTIRITWPCMGLVNEEILSEVLAAASPSVHIECMEVNPEILRALQSAGKLRAVSIMEIYGTSHDANTWRTEMDQFLTTETPALTKLDLHGCGCLSFAGLGQILFTSQHTLKELHLNVSWPNEYSWENFPVLTKLTKLSLLVTNNICNVSLFRGRHGNKFPNLKELHISFGCGTENGTVGPGTPGCSLVVPSVTRIDLEGNVDERGMEQLAQSFPNVVHMALDYKYYSGDAKAAGRDPREIWNVGKFKCLEKLSIWNFPVKQPSDDYINMDSFLTGMPVDVCKNLHKLNQLGLVQPSFNESLRGNQSLLQLKNLKELIVCVKIGGGFTEPSEDSPFISMVSVTYALEMMPDLRAKFVYEDQSPAFLCGHRKNAAKLKRLSMLHPTALEAAFKHVQPDVKLERFFY